MIGKFLDLAKTALTAAAIILVLHFTGLLGDVSFLAQSAVMKTGVLDADVPESTTSADFDYNFTVKDLKGDKHPFEEFKGKVIFLNMWATWCGPCRAEMPTIQDLYGNMKLENVVFVMLSIDKDQDHDKIVRYIQSKAYTFPVYQPSGYLTDQLSVPTIPTTFVISKDGKVASKYVGTTDFNTAKFKKFIDELASK